MENTCLVQLEYIVITCKRQLLQMATIATIKQGAIQTWDLIGYVNLTIIIINFVLILQVSLFMKPSFLHIHLITYAEL